MYFDRIACNLKEKSSLSSFFHRRSVLLKVLLSYIIIGAILISGLSTLLFKKFSESSMQDIKSISEKSLEQSYRVISTLWESTYMYMYKEFTTNSALANAMFSEEFSPAGTGEIFRRISEIVNNNDIIDSVYVCNSKADYVFSSIGPYTDTKSFYDSDIIKYIKSIQNKKGREFTVLYRKVSLKYPAGTNPKNIISVVFSNDDFNSAVVFNLNQNILQKTIGYGKNGQSSRTMIIGKDGIIISHPEPSMIFETAGDKSFFKKVRLSSAESGSYDEKTGNRKNLVIYRKWDFLGWYFISVDDYDNLLLKVRGLQKNILWITGAFILLSVLIAAFFIGNIYSPFYKLLGKIKAANPDASMKNLNEYDYLKNAYDSMHDSINSLKTYKIESKMVVKKELLNRIIHGKLAGLEETKKQIEELGLSLTSDRYIAVVLRFDDIIEKINKYSRQDMDLYRFAVSNIAEELFGDKFLVETVESSEDSVSIIVNVSQDENAIIPGIKPILQNIQFAVEEYLGFLVTAGIGTLEYGLKGIQLSNENALDAVNYRFIYGRKAVIDYRELDADRQEEYEYPIELEKSIIDGLKANDEIKVQNSLDSFMGSICKFGYDEILLALNQLMLLSLRTARNMLDTGEMQSIGIDVDFRTAKNDFKSYDTIEQVRDWMLRFYLSVIDVNKKKRENKYEDIIQKIISHMEANYNDPGLSVEALSGLVNLSPNYLRTLFKGSVGKSISGYLSELRFNKAREYLMNTELAANKIAEMVGLPGSGYFYTAFKKATGVSPDEFRKLCKDKDSTTG